MSTAAQETPREEALSLFTVRDKNGQVDATVPVRWCISRETAEMIKQKGIRNPLMVIVVEHQGQEKNRYVVPIKSEMRFIQFRSPGKNTIHATIMWDGESEAEKILKKDDSPLIQAVKPGLQAIEAENRELNEKIWAIERMDEGKVDKDELTALLAEREGLSVRMEDLAENEAEVMQFTPEDGWWSIHRLEHEVSIDVIVPEEMFAKKPPRLMSWLGNFLNHDTPPRDQCQLRNRALWAIPAMAIMAIPAMVLEVVNLAFIALLLLFGMRNIEYTALRHPFTYWPNSIGQNLEPSLWLSKKGEKREFAFREHAYYYEDRHGIFVILNPAVLAIIGAIGFGLYLWFDTFEWLLIGIGAAFVLAFLVWIIGGINASPISDFFRERRRQAKEASDKAKKAEQKRRDEEFAKDLEQLACSNASREVSVAALPKERQTVYLRFQNLKSKVCRPFAS